MNCHEKDENNANAKANGQGHLSHILMMALCCGAPVIIIFLLPLIGKVIGTGFSKALFRIVPFLCPLMMVFMMTMMLKGNKDKGRKSCCHHNKQVMPDEETPRLIRRGE